MYSAFYSSGYGNQNAALFSRGGGGIDHIDKTKRPGIPGRKFPKSFVQAHNQRQHMTFTSQGATNLYRGGKHLDAIALNDRIRGPKKAVLHAIASLMHVKGDFSEETWIYLDTLIKRSGFARATVCRAVTDLIKDGYLTKRHQRKEGDRKPCLYRLTDKLFLEFQDDQNVKYIQTVNLDNVTRLRVSE